MIQVGGYRSSYSFAQAASPGLQGYESHGTPSTPDIPRRDVVWQSPPTPPNNPPAVSETERHNVVVHWTQSGHSFTSGENSDEEEDNASNEDYRPFTPPPPRERLSYTRYQLELLNGIYTQVKYPNGTQKLLVAKRVGITRDQVKIWFQNRRRKDVIAKRDKHSDHTKEHEHGSGTTDDEENNQDIMVPDLVMNSVIAELNKFKNEHLKSKKAKQKKRSPVTAKSVVVKDTDDNEAKYPGLFSGYDMISPPNQITPSAYLNKSSRTYGFHHAKGSSAFARPKEVHKPTEKRYIENNSPANCVSHCLHDTKSYLDNSSPPDPGNHRTHYQIPDNSIQFDRLSTEPNEMFTISNGHLENTIPVLSDLLSFPGKMSSCDEKSRDYPFNASQYSFRRPDHEYRHRGHGATLSDLPLSSYQNGQMNTVGMNRMFPFPFIAEPAAMLPSSVRPLELCRPQPQYPSSAFSHHDPYQPLAVSSLSNPYYCQQQTTPLMSPWHEYSFQEHPSYTQL